MDLMTKMAILQTIADTLKLLAHLRASSAPEEQRHIDDMMLRLTTMCSVFQP